MYSYHYRARTRDVAVRYQGKTYYVDATNGNDANRGTDPSQAWQTEANVNSTTFQPGDTILFKKGETFTLTAAITVSTSGVQGRRIVFGAYGSGANPIIDGGDTVNCFSITSQSHLHFEDLNCTQGLDFGFAFNGCHHITVVACDAHDCGNDALIFINVCYSCSVSGGSFYNGYSRLADGRIVSGIEIADGSHDIIIDGAACYDNIDTGRGITIHSHAATNVPYNLTITDVTAYNNATYGIGVLKQDATVDTARNIVVQSCTLYDNTLDGLYLWDNGSGYLNGITVLANYSYSNDRQALFMRGDNISVARNVFSADATYPVYVENSIAAQFYNNTLYATVAYTGFNGMMYLAGARTSGFDFRNNIIEAEHTNPYQVMIPAGTGTTGINIDYNLYGYTGAFTRWQWLGTNKALASWLTDSSQDANSPAPADPAFTTPGSDFTLQQGSPAIGTGTDLGYGDDIGAYQYS